MKRWMTEFLSAVGDYQLVLLLLVVYFLFIILFVYLFYEKVDDRVSISSRGLLTAGAIIGAAES